MTDDEQIAPEESRGQGAYRHLYWDLHLTGDTRSQTYQLASLHELFHADLDVTSDFGTLLCVYAHLRRAGTTESAYAGTHSALVRHSRRTHETFATFLSLLVIADPGYSNWSLLPLKDYQLYVRFGHDLSRGLNGRFFRFHAALAALRLCMQAPVCRDVGAWTNQ